MAPNLLVWLVPNGTGMNVLLTFGLRAHEGRLYLQSPNYPPRTKMVLQGLPKGHSRDIKGRPGISLKKAYSDIPHGQETPGETRVIPEALQVP